MPLRTERSRRPVRRSPESPLQIVDVVVKLLALGFEPFLVLPLGCVKQRSPSCRLGVSEPQSFGRHGYAANVVALVANDGTSRRLSGKGRRELHGHDAAPFAALAYCSLRRLGGDQEPAPEQRLDQRALAMRQIVLPDEDRVFLTTTQSGGQRGQNRVKLWIKRAGHRALRLRQPDRRRFPPASCAAEDRCPHI
jgi:hypothetical protein